jgi:hypothetical protein
MIGSRPENFVKHWRVFDDVTKTINVPPSQSSSVEEYLDIRLTHKLHPGYTGDRHEYTLVVEIENVGTRKISDYQVDILFPKVFLDIERYSFEVEESNTHKLIRRVAAHFAKHPSGLYPGNILIDQLIKYSVDHQRYSSDYWMKQPVEVTVFADGIPSQKVSKPFSELQNF